MKEQKHIFSLFAPEVDQGKEKESLFFLTEKQLIHRVTTVLRMKKGDRCILFGIHRGIHGVFSHVTEKNSICFSITSFFILPVPRRTITLFLPCIEKSGIESLLYTAAQQRVTRIYMVIYDKSAVKSFFLNERYTKIMIAGSEQGKSFHIPRIEEKILRFDEMMALCKKETLPLYWLYEEASETLYEKYTRLPSSLAITGGPEGGYSEREEALLWKEFPLSASRLSSTILRSFEAIQHGCVLLNA